MSVSRSILRAVGALWFAGVLLILLLVAMACATVVESTHGTERALAEFYTSWWFEALLVLLGINVLAAVLLRYPFSKRQIGFVMTHAGILITLGGALVTQGFGVDGRVGLAEGETTERFTVRQDTLTVVNRADEARATVDLAGRAFGGLKLVDRPRTPVLSLGDLSIEVERYLPDGVWSKRVTDDNPSPRPAVEVSLSPTGLDDPEWILAGQTAALGTMEVAFRLVSDEEELRLASGRPNAGPADRSASKGTLRIEYRGSTFELALEDCLDQAAPLGETGYTVRVLRYLPHAVVGDGRKLVSASDRPVNPAVEVELVGPAGSEERLAFARFPHFHSMHDKKQNPELKLTFIAGQEPAPETSVEVLSGPDGKLLARFSPQDGEVVVHGLTIGAPVETPWPGWKLGVLRRFGYARVDWSVEPVESIRKARVPAVLLKLQTPEYGGEMWVQKFRPRTVTVEGTRYEVSYSDKSVPLGFALTLNRFRIGHYPGTGRPRSFESHVTILDPDTGRDQDRVISMNNPTKHAAYTLFQSSYSEAGGQMVSYLSVSRDPGLPIVFTGYIVTMAGMVVVLATRMIERRRTARARQTACQLADPAPPMAGLSVPVAEAGVAPPSSGLERHRGETPVTASELRTTGRDSNVEG